MLGSRQRHLHRTSSSDVGQRACRGEEFIAECERSPHYTREQMPRVRLGPFTRADTRRSAEDYRRARVELTQIQDPQRRCCAYARRHLASTRSRADEARALAREWRSPGIRGSTSPYRRSLLPELASRTPSSGPDGRASTRSGGRRPMARREGRSSSGGQYAPMGALRRQPRRAAEANLQQRIGSSTGRVTRESSSRDALAFYGCRRRHVLREIARAHSRASLE